MAIGPDQHRVVARGRTSGDPAGDLGGDPVRLLGAGRERLEPDRRGRRGRAHRPEPFRQSRSAPRAGRGRCAGRVGSSRPGSGGATDSSAAGRRSGRRDSGPGSRGCCRSPRRGTHRSPGRRRRPRSRSDAARRGGRPAPPGPGSCPGIRRPIRSGIGRRPAVRAAADSRTSRSARATWSPKSMNPFWSGAPGTGHTPGRAPPCRLAVSRPASPSSGVSVASSGSADPAAAATASASAAARSA